MTPATETMSEQDKAIITMIRDFVKREVEPAALEMENKDVYPFALVERMKSLGLFGCTISEQYGGMGLSVTTYVRVIEEICKGWMSVSGIINAHLIMAYIVEQFATEDQKRRWLPNMATGETRGGFALTEPDCGSDVSAIRTFAVKHGDHYVVNGNKMMTTNGEHGTTFLVLVKTDREIQPPHKGLSAFIMTKGNGFRHGRHLDKLGYRGVDTSELIFEDFRVPADGLIGKKEGQGFKYVMNGLELGRINVASRAVGVATAAFEKAIAYAQQRKTFGVPIAEHQAIQLKLADMYTRIEASRLLVRQAAEKKDRGERCDLEAGMAKLFASETCGFVSLEAMRIHGGYGFFKDYTVERYYRDAPLMMIGEGTNEIQRLVIARNLLQLYQAGA
ncbi:MAG: acyl-CoA dehydrogenase [Chloroflexi bacterium]|nr:acyl-CoA dehydrogenase [Chloroflexota bacterium]